jgi:hypothetical protein
LGAQITGQLDQPHQLKKNLRKKRLTNSGQIYPSSFSSFPKKQISFADAEYADKHKQIRRERFLVEMDQVVPRKGLIALIEPHYPK